MLIIIASENSLVFMCRHSCATLEVWQRGYSRQTAYPDAAIRKEVLSSAGAAHRPPQQGLCACEHVHVTRIQF